MLLSAKSLKCQTWRWECTVLIRVQESRELKVSSHSQSKTSPSKVAIIHFDTIFRAEIEECIIL